MLAAFTTALALSVWRFHMDSRDNFTAKMASNKYEIKHFFINWAVILSLCQLLEAGSTERVVTSVWCGKLLYCKSGRTNGTLD
jgi:hypothetical protein